MHAELSHAKWIYVLAYFPCRIKFPMPTTELDTKKLISSLTNTFLTLNLIRWWNNVISQLTAGSTFQKWSTRWWTVTFIFPNFKWHVWDATLETVSRVAYQGSMFLLGRFPVHISTRLPPNQVNFRYFPQPLQTQTKTIHRRWPRLLPYPLNMHMNVSTNWTGQNTYRWNSIVK
jgi:hypothetical protein